ncbi:5-methylcytosine-specific restriction protein A [Anaerobacterium chartisolvens]|uniref:5-methylcytosine-specific restriction protein A n=1 Tax=Anaerobacterium chartisolvens TaxID=1297424 RepID=A0A369B6T0_9FIRM|nr:HNH endonuclease [Anaerobacterium chartisolvens]RCX17232.1 5-methylcytosine-specific restriction protein A [Anaerobacterium chartisolvens]
MFIPGKIYNRRRDIHAIYGGQQQGGICTPVSYPMVIIFTGDNGNEFGYKDGWTDDGIYQYTGEGQVYDMQFIKGNKAIRDHEVNGKDLCLFQYVKSGEVRFINYMVYTGHHLRQSLDKNGNMRQAIVFELTPVYALDSREEVYTTNDEPDLRSKSLNELRSLAEASRGGSRTVKEKQKEIHIRSSAVKEYALKRAQGICECCGKPGPFEKEDASRFLEVHHIKRLSDGGPDKPEWVSAICPNCHREAHYGKNKILVKEKLLEAVSLKEKELAASHPKGSPCISTT